MLITEIAVQNILGFPAAARIALKAGLNALVSRESDVAVLLRAILYPAPGDAEALTVRDAPTRKAAVTVVGRDGHSYRIVRDFAAGRTLLRSDPTTRQAVKITDDPAQLVEQLRTVVGLPGEELFRAHLALSAGDLPGRRRPVRPAASVRETTLPPHHQNAAPSEQPPTIDEARRRLPELRSELEKIEGFEQIQDALYALQNRLSELSKGSEGAQELERQVAQYDARLDAFDRLVKDVSVGLETRIRKYPEAAARKDGALAELKKKRGEYEARQGVVPSFAALLRDQVLLAGLGAGLLCVVLALTVDTMFWFLDLVGFGAAGFAGLRWVAQVEEADHDQRRLGDLVELEKRIHRQYELDTQPVVTAIRLLGVNNADEALARFEERDMIEARRSALVRELEMKLGDPKLLALEQERSAVEKELREREAVVNSVGFTRDAGLVRREILACEGVLDDGGPVDPLPAAIEGVAAFAGLHPKALIDGLRDRLAQYLSALTDRRFIGVLPLGPGNYQIIAHGGASGPLLGLPPADRDLIYVAVRLALAERAAGPAKLPLFFDEPTLLVGAAHAALLVKMLKALGAVTQVVVRAFEPPPAGAVDHVARPVGPAPSSPPA